MTKISAETVYTECGTTFRYLIDWRYRVMIQYFVALSAIFAAVVWVYGNAKPLLIKYAYLPCGLVAVFSTIGFLMSLRNIYILNKCEAVLDTLERENADTPGVYAEWAKNKLWPLPYDVMFPAIYLIIGVPSIILCIRFWLNAPE